MIDYLGGVLGSWLGIIFFVFIIAALGYLVGGIRIKGISLGTAGVLLVALLFGVLAHFVPNFTVGGTTIALFDAGLKTKFGLVSNIGTALFVTAVGLIAGPKLFRTFNRKSLAYVCMGVVVILTGALTALVCTVLDGNLSMDMAVGLLTGGLTSTPGLSAAKEVAKDEAAVTAGYGIAYLFGVLGVVLFVQLVPKIMHVDMEKERASFVAANAVEVKPIERKLVELEPFGFFPFFLAIAMGCLIGSLLKFPASTSRSARRAGR